MEVRSYGCLFLLLLCVQIFSTSEEELILSKEANGTKAVSEEGLKVYLMKGQRGRVGPAGGNSGRRPVSHRNAAASSQRFPSSSFFFFFFPSVGLAALA